MRICYILMSFYKSKRGGLHDGLQEANHRTQRPEYENATLKAQVSKATMELGECKRVIKRAQNQYGSTQDFTSAMHADWSLVLDFFAQSTSPGATMLGDKLLIPPSVHVAPDLGPDTLLVQEIKYINERLVSGSTTIDDFTFFTLANTIQWKTDFLPHVVDQAVVCTDGVAFMHGIGKEFATTGQTHNTMHQHKRAGISSAALNLHSSFQTKPCLRFWAYRQQWSWKTPSCCYPVLNLTWSGFLSWMASLRV
jgi:hypothetical protein